MSYTTVSTPTGQPSYVDALMLGFKHGTGIGTAATVTYNFSTSYTGGSAFNSALVGRTMSAMQEMSNVANITFALDNNPSTAQLTFSTQEAGGSVLGFFQPLDGPDSNTIYGEVVMDDDIPTQYNGYGANSIGFSTLMHEIGHALGLKHPGNYGGGETGPFLPAGQDSNDNTVMSYHYGNQVGGYTRYGLDPSTLMPYDIAALQYLYGANMSFHTGNDNYVFGQLYAGTIWDAGGRDTINASNQTTGVTIDLFQGAGHTSIIGNSYVWIAYNAQIEDAFGGYGNDFIRGNELANVLYGRGGSDSIYGGIGNDTILGGVTGSDPADPSDLIYGGNGNDLIYGNGGNDTLNGGGGVADVTEGADTFYGGEGFDVIAGNGGNDIIYVGTSYADTIDAGNIADGEAGNDIVYGSNGTDTIAGGAGLDSLYGAGGNDTIYGDADNTDPSSNDLINGDAGNDLLYGYSGGDLIYGGTGLDTIFGGAGNDTVYGNPDNDVMYGGAGNDSGFGGVGNDTLYGGNDSVDSTDGNDELYGSSGNDWVYGSGGSDAIYGDLSITTTSDDGADVLFGGEGNDTLFGAGGNDTLIGGNGSDVLYGGGGNDRFNFPSGSGTDAISGFENPGVGVGDVIVLASNLNGSGIYTAADVLSHISYSGGNATVDLGGGNSVILVSISPGTLTADDFMVL